MKSKNSKSEAIYSETIVNTTIEKTITTLNL